jgi:uroporphyrinogen decarboxylase
MNDRERFHATMHYLPRDRCPIMDFRFWEETRVIWQEQGLPKDANTDIFFGMDAQWIGAPIAVNIRPSFGHTVLEDRGDTWIVRDEEGVTKEQGKFLGSIPQMLDHALKDRESWEQEFKWRLDGRNPDRYPKDWAKLVEEYNRPDRDYPLGIHTGSLYGWLRNWMGVEALSMLVYDDPGLFQEMVETVADCIIDAITPALEAGIQFEYANMWEDMCYRAGPLLSPKMFKQTLVPNYKRITSLLKKYGVDVVIVDCDGDISKLASLWLEGGVNTMFPLEIGVWGADPVAYRKQYGKEMLIIGGVSKRLLAGPIEEIKREVERLAPLVEEGGFIPTPDHLLPPDVPLDNYIFYLEEARRVWGKGLPNLKLMGERTNVVSSMRNITRYAVQFE